jgi:hypothetical protein
MQEQTFEDKKWNHRQGQPELLKHFRKGREAPGSLCVFPYSVMLPPRLGAIATEESQSRPPPLPKICTYLSCSIDSLGKTGVAQSWVS